MPKHTPTTDGAVGLPLVPVNEPTTQVILPVAVLVVADEIPLPLIDRLVVDLRPVVVDMLPDEAIVLTVVELVPAAVIVPFVVVLPFANIANC